MWDDEGGNLPGRRLTLPTTRLWNQEVLTDPLVWQNYDPGDVREPSREDSGPECHDAKKNISTENHVTDSVETSTLTAEGGFCLGGGVPVLSDIIKAGWQHPEPEYFGFIWCRWRGQGHSGHL